MADIKRVKEDCIMHDKEKGCIALTTDVKWNCYWKKNRLCPFYKKKK